MRCPPPRRAHLQGPHGLPADQLGQLGVACTPGRAGWAPALARPGSASRQHRNTSMITAELSGRRAVGSSPMLGLSGAAFCRGAATHAATDRCSHGIARVSVPFMHPGTAGPTCTPHLAAVAPRGGWLSCHRPALGTRCLGNGDAGDLGCKDGRHGATEEADTLGWALFLPGSAASTSRLRGALKGAACSLLPGAAYSQGAPHTCWALSMQQDEGMHGMAACNTGAHRSRHPVRRMMWQPAHKTDGDAQSGLVHCMAGREASCDACPCMHQMQRCPAPRTKSRTRVAEHWLAELSNLQRKCRILKSLLHLSAPARAQGVGVRQCCHQ